MGTPPLTLFARTPDPAGVLAILGEVGAVELQGDPGDWQLATVRWKTGWFRRHQLVVSHSRAYYAGPDWPRQVVGMGNYFAQLGAAPDVMGLVRHLGFALSFPDVTAPTDPADPVHAVLRRLAAHLDGVFFTPGHLLDREGRVLAGPGGARDPAAVVPAVPESPAVDLDEDVEPPTADRVARRALCLAAISMRALAELEPDPERIDGLRRALRSWLADVGADDELEPGERVFLERPDRPPQQELLNGVWRVEGLAVLCWALGLADLPPYDQLVEPPTVWRALGVLSDPEQGRARVAEAVLRDEAALEALATHLLAFHWRVRDYRLRPRAMDFVAFSRSCWFGSFPLDDFRIVDGDLALGGVAIDEAGPEEVGKAASTAQERHLAINWLLGGARVYSETDTST